MNLRLYAIELAQRKCGAFQSESRRFTIIALSPLDIEKACLKSECKQILGIGSSFWSLMMIPFTISSM